MNYVSGAHVTQGWAEVDECALFWDHDRQKYRIDISSLDKALLIDHFLVLKELYLVLGILKVRTVSTQ